MHYVEKKIKELKSNWGENKFFFKDIDNLPFLENWIEKGIAEFYLEDILNVNPNLRKNKDLFKIAMCFADTNIIELLHKELKYLNIESSLIGAINYNRINNVKKFLELNSEYKVNFKIFSHALARMQTNNIDSSILDVLIDRIEEFNSLDLEYLNDVLPKYTLNKFSTVKFYNLFNQYPELDNSLKMFLKNNNNTLSRFKIDYLIENKLPHDYIRSIISCTNCSQELFSKLYQDGEFINTQVIENYYSSKKMDEFSIYSYEAHSVEVSSFNQFMNNYIKKWNTKKIKETIIANYIYDEEFFDEKIKNFNEKERNKIYIDIIRENIKLDLNNEEQLSIFRKIFIELRNKISNMTNEIDNEIKSIHPFIEKYLKKEKLIKNLTIKSSSNSNKI